jgi:TetR/AcrR family transcriptional repressor of nem operon
MMIVMYNVKRHLTEAAMRVSRKQFLENREKILAAAGRLFRERGLDQVTVAEVMQAAGLTHGGFYGHFKSKDDLIVQTLGGGSQAMLDRWGPIAGANGPEGLKALAQVYLSEAHRHSRADGCLVAALGPEIARQSDLTRGGVTASLKKVVAVMEAGAPGATADERRKQALAAYAGWIGAMVLARISDDEAFSREILAAVA